MIGLNEIKKIYPPYFDHPIRAGGLDIAKCSRQMFALIEELENLEYEDSVYLYSSMHYLHITASHWNNLIYVYFDNQKDCFRVTLVEKKRLDQAETIYPSNLFCVVDFVKQFLATEDNQEVVSQLWIKSQGAYCTD